MPAKRETIAVLLDSELLEEAQAMDIDVSHAAEAGIARAIAAKNAASTWAADNADVVRSNNEYIAKHGLPLRKYRTF